jgi:hypothetical protein
MLTMALSCRFAGDVTAVEIVWNGVLQRRFFHIPDICYDLSKASRDKLVEEGASADHPTSDLRPGAGLMHSEPLAPVDSR